MGRVLFAVPGLLLVVRAMQGYVRHQSAESAARADLPQFVKDEFDAFLECGILAHGFLAPALR